MQEKEIETIKTETKKLLDKFSKSLDTVKSSEEWNVKRDEDRRKDGEGKNVDKDFRKIMLENAPNKNEDFILAEKKTW
jgi:Asp-tRNA(Asn)/Glu-tRNA(Gln) amidotransferase C subunit